MYLHVYTVGTQSSVLISEMSLFQRCPLREVPLYVRTSKAEWADVCTHSCDVLHSLSVSWQFTLNNVHLSSGFIKCVRLRYSVVNSSKASNATYL